MSRNTPALRDDNDRAIASGVSFSDSVTTVMFRVDPITDYLLVDNSTDSLTPSIATRNRRDDNDVPTQYGVSSLDGVTPVPIRTDSNGKLLVTYT
jgi:hypothetical protein